MKMTENISGNSERMKRSFGRAPRALVLAACASLLAGTLMMAQAAEPSRRSFTLSSGVVTLTVATDSGRISYDELASRPAWARANDGRSSFLRTDGNFAVDIYWTGWSAPGKVNNADNAVTFTGTDFLMTGSKTSELPHHGKELDLYFKGIGLPFQLEVSYRLDSAAFYVHRRISIRDTVNHLQFLRRIHAADFSVDGAYRVVKDGGFGQPVAVAGKSAGAFWGLEYPAGVNSVSTGNSGMKVDCGEVFGERIGGSWIRSHWAVEGITPNKYVKLWFMKYVKRIRVAPAEPYTLYNTWYDLRSPRFTDIGKDHVMNQKNIMRIIDALRRNMIEKHGIRLNAFVLDDGWDKYQSAWELRKSTFPNGLKPIVDDLKKTNTTLGLWLGPIGGYSFRNLRVDWMKAHGYETVGGEMCLGGKHYSQLFKKRVVDFAKDDGVGYYKWDGIQFSCSQPDHGHPVGIYSRDAILDTLINISRAVRAVNPHAYLNITSGTWLSPWWVQYANQIWMQGGDYGYSDVPSLSPRDAAMTYRDLTLYDDFKTNDFWFPIANLMTHGIIKGTLEQLGGANEPLDRFTNEAVLYFARGVSMWELYLSPGILTDGEWNAISTAILWARNRFPILSNTEMIGGDPGKRETYGYVHFRGHEGIVAARNPWIKEASLKVALTPALGFSPNAKSLVVERVYPDRWISPRLYSSGESFEIPLDGYETAVYEIFPIDSARTPLVSDVRFQRSGDNGRNYALNFYDAGSNVSVMNPGVLRDSRAAERIRKALSELSNSPNPVSLQGDVKSKNKDGKSLEFTLYVAKSVKKSSLDLLLEPSSAQEDSALPALDVSIDGATREVKPIESSSKSKWYKIAATPGKHLVKVFMKESSGRPAWTGKLSCWVSVEQLHRSKSITFDLKRAAAEPPMPPRELPSAETETHLKLFVRNVSLRSGR